MTRRKVDLRFTEVGYELMMLAQYIALLESNLPAVVHAEKERVWVDLDPDKSRATATPAISTAPVAVNVEPIWMLPGAN